MGRNKHNREEYGEKDKNRKHNREENGEEDKKWGKANITGEKWEARTKNGEKQK